MQPVISPRSDLYDMKQEPCTPPQYNSNEFIQQLMFNEGELKTDYDTGNRVCVCVSIYRF